MEDQISRRRHLLPLAVVLALVLAVSVFGCSIIVRASDDERGASSPVETKDPFAGKPDQGVADAGDAVAAGAPDRAGALSVKWSAPPIGTTFLVGRWVTDDALYLGSAQSLLRYSSQDGAVREIPLLRPNSELVGMSADPKGALGAVASVQNGQIHVSAVDLATDQIRFSIPVTGFGHNLPRPVRLAVNSSMVVAVVGNLVHALDIRDGRSLWTRDAASSRWPSAQISGVLIDDKTVLLSAEVRDELAGVGISLNAADGSKLWDELVTRNRTRTASVVNINPPTFFVTAEDGKTRTLAVTDDRGRLAHFVRTEPDDDLALPNFETTNIGDLAHERPVLIVDGVLYVRTQIGREGNGVTAIDLRTGNAKWRTLLPVGTDPMATATRVFMAGSAPGEVFVVAANEGVTNQGFVLWRLSTADGVLTKHAAGPAVVGGFGTGFGQSITWTGRELYVVREFTSGPSLKIGF